MPSETESGYWRKSCTQTTSATQRTVGSGMLCMTRCARSVPCVMAASRSSIGGKTTAVQKPYYNFNLINAIERRKPWPVPSVSRVSTPADMARASFGLYNTREEVDALVEGIQKAREVFA